MTEDKKIQKLTWMLNECLEPFGQDNTFKVRGIESGKFVVEFDIVEVEEDDYIGFAGY